MNILVTGGAGYVGSVCAEQLLAEQHKVVIVDNLSTGHREAVPPDALFVEADIAQSEVISEVVNRHRIEAAMHFAGETLVTKSMTDPQRYFENNLRKGIAFLDTILRNGVKKIIFSSTAAIFGEPVNTPITESHPVQPINAYGESKLMFEKVLAWYQRAYGLRYVAVRYFNAAGASAEYGEDHRPETHLIPLVLQAALDSSREVHIYGDDYPTADGTCVRDYVHVLDIAQAHILALTALDKGLSGTYNVGTGSGNSVRDIMRAAEAVTGRKLRVTIAPRRPGDPAVLVAGHEKLVSELGWNPRHSKLTEIIGSAWHWQQEHPRGYATGENLSPIPIS